MHFQYSLLRLLLVVGGAAALFGLLKSVSPSLPPAVVVLGVLAIAIAALSHLLCRAFWRANIAAAAIASSLFVVCSLLLVRSDGWAGWLKEVPHVISSLLICFVLSLGMSALVGFPFYASGLFERFKNEAGIEEDA